MMQPTVRKLKRVVLKEELVALTGCYKQAIILNQFLYWSERVRDFDKLIKEEQARSAGVDIELRHGWIYKPAAELAEETLLGLSKGNMRTHIKRLVEAGWIVERRNPHAKMDHTLQYRVNFVKLRQDLQAIGYDLHGYVFDEPEPEPEPEPDNEVTNHDPESRNVISRSESLHNEVTNYDPELRIVTSRSDSLQQYQRLLNRDYNKNNMIDRLSDNKQQNEILQALSDVLKQINLHDTVTLYDAYFDVIYAMLLRQFPDKLEPDIIRRAGVIYLSRTLDDRTLERKINVYNPPGLFCRAYEDALAEFYADKWKNRKVGYG